MALREHIDRFLGKPKSVSRCPCEELAEIKNDWGLISALGHLGAGDFRLYRAHALERFPESRFPSWRLWKLSQRYQRLLSACYRLKVQQGEIEEDEELLREY